MFFKNFDKLDITILTFDRPLCASKMYREILLVDKKQGTFSQEESFFCI